MTVAEAAKALWAAANDSGNDIHLGVVGDAGDGVTFNPDAVEDGASLPAAGGDDGGGKIPAKPAAGSCNPEPPNSKGLTEGDVGSWRTLRRLGEPYDNLTPHHMPQAALGFTPYQLGATVALSHANHANTRTYLGKGRITKRGDAGRRFQDVLNDDYNDLRGLGACFDVEHSIDAVQWYYETNFPNLVGG